MDDARVALLAKAMSHPARISILRMLAAQDQCMGAQLFGGLPLAQSTVSQHLSVLRDAGLVKSHSAGQSHVYCLCSEELRALAETVESLASGAPGCQPIDQECR